MRSEDANDRGRVLLVGRGPTALGALEALAGRFEVVGIVRDGDDATTARAADLTVPVFGDTSVNALRAAVAALTPDAVVVSSYDRILGPDLTERCPFVNVHYAPLPRGRGRATVNWALINGDDHVAITIHHIVPELDAGGILAQATVPVGPASTATTLYGQLDALQRRHLPDAVAAAIAGDPGRPQDEAAATYYCTRLPEDGEIDWEAPARRIDRLVRALQPPFPAAYTWLGLEQLHVERAMAIADPPTWEGRIPGRVVAIHRRSGSVDVLAGEGVIRIERVRLGEGALVSATDVIRSVKTTLGLRTTDLVERLRRLEP